MGSTPGSCATANYRLDHLDAGAGAATRFSGSREGRTPTHYGYGAEKTLDLGDCDSARLWSLLDEAARLGLKLIHAPPGARRGALRAGRAAARRHAARGRVGGRAPQGPAWLVSPTLQFDGEDAARPRAAAVPRLQRTRRRMRRARPAPTATARCPSASGCGSSALRRPAPPPLQRMLLDGRAACDPRERARALRRGVLPRAAAHWRRSSPPTARSRRPRSRRRRSCCAHATAPTTPSRSAGSGPIGSARRTRHAPFAGNGAGAGFRDLDAERAILARTDLTGSGLERFGLVDDGGRPAAGAAASLTGLDSLRLTTEVLPRLAAAPGRQRRGRRRARRLPRRRRLAEIGLSTAELAGERDWFDLGVTISVEGRELPFAEVFAALASGESQMLLDGRRPLLAARARAAVAAAADRGGPRARRLAARVAADQPLPGGAVGRARRARRRRPSRRRRGSARSARCSSSTRSPSTSRRRRLQAELRPYQREGFGWLASLWDLELGGILADDMGLGKTLQALALDLPRPRARPATLGPFLVVAPTSVVPGWVRRGRPLRPRARRRRGDRHAREVGAHDRASSRPPTSSSRRTRSSASTPTPTARCPWAGLILDEAQYVKNHQAKTYRCVRELAAPFKLAITGTPMENNLMELWSLLSITAPGLFPDPKRFAEQYARPIERGGDTERLARLRRRIKPLVKRRTKELVAARPAGQAGADARGRPSSAPPQALRHPPAARAAEDPRAARRLQPQPLHDPALDHAAAPAQPARGPRRRRQRRRFPCAKLGALVEQLGDVIGGGHRALVFSQFTGFLAKVARAPRRARASATATSTAARAGASVCSSASRTAATRCS